jgi:hypothetical protein
MRKDFFLIIISIFLISENVFSQQTISGWLNLEINSFKVEQIKKIDLDSNWNTFLSLNKSKKALSSTFEINNNSYQILLIPDLAVKKTSTSKSVFKGKELSRNNDLGSWDLFVNGNHIADLEIKTLENGRIVEYLLSCSSGVLQNRYYSREKNKYDNNFQYRGDFWAYSWEGDFYFGENPLLSKTSSIRCQIFYHNGDIFYGFVDRDFELVGKGKYVFKSHPKYSEYKGYFLKSKFDDSNHPTLPGDFSTLNFKDGKVVNGSFLRGNINVNEKCCIIYANGDTYCGYVTIDFIRNGEGEISYNNGGGYLGNWSNEFYSGIGKVIYNDGVIIEGVWDKNKLVDLQDKKTLHHIFPKEARDNLSLYKSSLGVFELQKKQYSNKIDFQQKLINKGLIEVVELIGDKQLDSKLIKVLNERTGNGESKYINTIQIPCGPSIGRYVVKIEKTKTNLLVIKFIEIHKNNILNYTLNAKSLESTINNDGKLDGPWQVQTNLGYGYDIEFNNGEAIQLYYNDKIITYEVKLVTLSNSKVFQGTYTEVNSKRNETLVYKAIWNSPSGVKILQGLHLINGDSLYFGNYENDKRQGYGVAILIDKKFKEKGYYKYRGQWCNNKILGSGEMLLKDNKWKDGFWIESNEIDISLSRLPQKFEFKYKPFNNHLSTFKIMGNQIEIIDKEVEKRATSPSINLINTSAIQRSNGVVNPAIIVPRKTGFISFQEFNCNKIIYRINWSDGTSDDLNLNLDFNITGITQI